MSDIEKTFLALFYVLSCVICLASLTAMFKDGQGRSNKEPLQVLWAVTPFINTLMAIGVVFFTLICLSFPHSDEETS